jgi:hypothetical protein
MPDNPASGTPQFGTAEYASKPGTDSCKSCNQPVRGTYYRVNGAVACANCAQQLQNQLPKDSHSAFVRGIIFGVGGAILGLIIYAGFGIITGLMLGYISLAVGYIVGKAIMMGSNGFGGRRYQIAAVLLTYFAVSMAAVPIGISQVIKHQKELREARMHSPAAAASTDSSSSTSNTDDPSQSTAPDNPPATHQKPSISLASFAGKLLFVGLASPFLDLQDPFHGVIGLIILFVGLRIAWKLTEGKKVEILGPFGDAVPAPAPLG